MPRRRQHYTSQNDLLTVSGLLALDRGPGWPGACGVPELALLRFRNSGTGTYGPEKTVFSLTNSTDNRYYEFMKLFGLLFISAALPLCSFASQIDLHNTGVNANGTLAAVGSTDQFYTSAGTTVFVVAQHPAWAVPGGANYVAPDTNQGQDYSGGVYALDYSTSFDLAGLDSTSVLIEGSWSTDNYGTDILVNGVSSGFTSPGFGSFSTFSLAGSSGLFHDGMNTLDFQWGNTGGPGGIAVQFSTATASPTPEPASLALVGLGLGILGIGNLRRKRNA
jgi:hypothetical protein